MKGASVERSLRGALAAAGALLACATVLLNRLQDHAFRGPATGRANALLGVVLLGLAGGVASLRLFRAMRKVSECHELRAAGLAFAYAGLLLAGAGYASNRWISFTAQLVAAVLLGVGLGPVLRVLAARRGAVRATTTALVAGTAGAFGAVLGPVLANAVAVYGQLRVWDVVRPATVPGMRAALLVAVIAGLAGAARASTAGRQLAAEQANRATRGEAAASVPRTPARRHPDAILEVVGLDLSYDRMQVLFGVDFHVDEGEAVALLGTNGAGKSSLLRAVFGLNRPSAGRVWFRGVDVTGRPAERLAGEGMLSVPGGHGVFPSLSVRENLRMAGYRLAGAARVRQGIERATTAFPRLAARIDQPAGVLSGGEQQMLALARAWIVRPKLLAIDELTLGLAPAAIGELLEFVHELRAEGVSIVVVEQSAQVAFEICDRAYFLERGQVRFDGRTADLMLRHDLLRSVFFDATLPAGTGPASGTGA